MLGLITHVFPIDVQDGAIGVALCGKEARIKPPKHALWACRKCLDLIVAKHNATAEELNQEIARSLRAPRGPGRKW